MSSPLVMGLFARTIALALWLGLSGCATTGLIDEPKYRVGVLPFPGVMSGLTIPSPDKLGQHHYEGASSLFSTEQARGLLYSCDAGFLDVAHIRKNADWTRYLALEIRKTLSEGADKAIITAEEPSRYHLSFRYPSFWSDLAPAEKDVLLEELSIRLGQHIAELASTWHEIISFFGYNSTIFLSEKPSAFTYDDMTSNMAGVEIAGIAMHDKAHDYDEAITRALSQELARLKVVSAEEANRALFQVKGLWWDDDAGKKWDLQIALNNEPVVPWLVRNLPFCPDARPVPFQLADLTDVNGRDFTGFIDLAIEPNIADSDKILSLFSPRPQYIRPHQHFPAIMAYIRSALVKDFGEDADKPYPQATASQ